MENTDYTAAILFLLTTVITVLLFYIASNKSGRGLVILTIWLLFQSLLSLSGFYQLTYTIPPRITVLLLPAIVFIIALFGSSRGRYFIDQLNPSLLCLMFVIRIPVELVLYELFLKGQVPKGMTFAGGNYDIFSGLSAPVIYYYGFVKKLIDRKIILVWNFICLGLLSSVVIHALLSVPTPFQLRDFNQPNIAILHFPYTLLPSLIVPLVLFSHLAIFRLLWSSVDRRHSFHKSDYQGN